MEARQVRTFMDAAKFIPFDVRTASGPSYHVRSREMTWMSPQRDLMLVYDPDAGVALIEVDDVTECVRPIGRKPGKKG